LDNNLPVFSESVSFSFSFQDLPLYDGITAVSNVGLKVVKGLVVTGKRPSSHVYSMDQELGNGSRHSPAAFSQNLSRDEERDENGDVAS
jgi:hypothetical protein